jgi:hypothetical protein
LVRDRSHSAGLLFTGEAKISTERANRIRRIYVRAGTFTASADTPPVQYVNNMHAIDWFWPRPCSGLVDGIAIHWSETMKGNISKNFRAVSLALGLALGSAELTPVLLAQPQSQDPNAPLAQKSQMFLGKIVKIDDGQYALLTDEKAGRGILLDDQEKAKRFEGKNVKVIGILDVAKKMVHVTDIELA